MVHAGDLHRIEAVTVVRLVGRAETIRAIALEGGQVRIEIGDRVGQLGAEVEIDDAVGGHRVERCRLVLGFRLAGQVLRGAEQCRQDEAILERAVGRDRDVIGAASREGGQPQRVFLRRAEAGADVEQAAEVEARQQVFQIAGREGFDVIAIVGRVGAAMDLAAIEFEHDVVGAIAADQRVAAVIAHEHRVAVAVDALDEVGVEIAFPVEQVDVVLVGEQELEVAAHQKVVAGKAVDGVVVIAGDDVVHLGGAEDLHLAGDAGRQAGDARHSAALGEVAEVAEIEVVEQAGRIPVEFEVARRVELEGGVAPGGDDEADALAALIEGAGEVVGDDQRRTAVLQPGRGLQVGEGVVGRIAVGGQPSEEVVEARDDDVEGVGVVGRQRVRIDHRGAGTEQNAVDGDLHRAHVRPLVARAGRRTGDVVGGEDQLGLDDLSRAERHDIQELVEVAGSVDVLDVFQLHAGLVVAGGDLAVLDRTAAGQAAPAERIAVVVGGIEVDDDQFLVVGSLEQQPVEVLQRIVVIGVAALDHRVTGQRGVERGQFLVEEVGIAAALQQVGTGAARQEVVADAALDDVVAGAAQHDVAVQAGAVAAEAGAVEIEVAGVALGVVGGIKQRQAARMRVDDLEALDVDIGADVVVDLARVDAVAVDVDLLDLLEGIGEVDADVGIADQAQGVDAVGADQVDRGIGDLGRTLDRMHLHRGARAVLLGDDDEFRAELVEQRALEVLGAVDDVLEEGIDVGLEAGRRLRRAGEEAAELGDGDVAAGNLVHPELEAGEIGLAAEHVAVERGHDLDRAETLIVALELGRLGKIGLEVGGRDAAADHIGPEVEAGLVGHAVVEDLVVGDGGVDRDRFRRVHCRVDSGLDSREIGGVEGYLGVCRRGSPHVRKRVGNQ